MKDKERRRYLVHNTTEVHFNIVERVLILIGWVPITYLTIDTNKPDIKVVESKATTLLSRPKWLEKKNRAFKMNKAEVRT